MRIIIACVFVLLWFQVGAQKSTFEENSVSDCKNKTTGDNLQPFNDGHVGGWLASQVLFN